MPDKMAANFASGRASLLFTRKSNHALRAPVSFCLKKGFLLTILESDELISLCSDCNQPARVQGLRAVGRRRFARGWIKRERGFEGTNQYVFNTLAEQCVLGGRNTATVEFG